MRDCSHLVFSRFVNGAPENPGSLLSARSFIVETKFAPDEVVKKTYCTPYARPFRTAPSRLRISRSASREAIEARLSCVFFPRAIAISHLIKLFLKYSRSGTIVRPCSAVLDAIFAISLRCSKSFRARVGSWFCHDACV